MTHRHLLGLVRVDRRTGALLRRSYGARHSAHPVAWHLSMIVFLVDHIILFLIMDDVEKRL